MILGVTGTRQGWSTDAQRERAQSLICGLRPDVLIHGDCVGIDEEIHNFVRTQTWETKIEVYPCGVFRYRACCKGDVVHNVGPPLERNKLIVEVCEMLIAIPKGDNEEIRSGTWSTVRYARRINCRVFIVWPNGRTEVL